jgi:4-carboxymuconolactone decarboxylase
MTLDIVVPDTLYAEVRQHFDVQGQLDLVATVAAYNMVSRLLVALQIGH